MRLRRWNIRISCCEFLQKLDVVTSVQLALAVTAWLVAMVTAQNVHENEFGCHCMEYWTCIMSGGQTYSYCGLSASSVCCFIPYNAKPVGILPSARKSKSCGRKGANGSRDGEAEMYEWPWHAAVLETRQDLYVCGASLLADTWVLTAAHCVDD